MNKDKLIGLIIKKETYKDSRPVQADILRNKEDAVNVSISAITQILKEDYNAEAKLYAIRYLKDCFQKGSQSFIIKVETKILGLLVKMVQDSQNQEAILKYGGSYTKSADLEKFKSLVTSLFKMSRQCIEKWAKWIPDSSRGFIKAQKSVSNIKDNPNVEGYVYFRQENETLFRQNCAKNGMSLTSLPESKQIINPKVENSPTPAAKKQNKQITKMNFILESMQEQIKKGQKLNEKQIAEIEAKFNVAINEYAEEASEFNEHFLDAKFERFEDLKKDLLIKQKAGSVSQTKQSEGKRQNMQQVQSQLRNTGKGFTHQNNSSTGSLLQQNNNSLQRTEAPKNKNLKEGNLSKLKNSSQLSGKSQQRVNFDRSESDLDSNQQKTLLPIKVQNSPSFSKQNQLKNAQVSNPSFQHQNINTKSQQQFPPFNLQENGKTTNSQMRQVNEQKTVSSFSNAIHLDSPSFLKKKQQSAEVNAPFILQQPQRASQIKQEQLNQRYKQDIEQLNNKYGLETHQLNEKLKGLQREMLQMREKEEKMKLKLNNALENKEVDSLKRQLYQQKNDKYLMGQQINELKSELKKMKSDFEKQKQDLKAFTSVNPSKVRVNENESNAPSIINQSNFKLSKVKSNINVLNAFQNGSKPENRTSRSILVSADSPANKDKFPTRIDQDYLQNLTHYENIGSWLNKENTLLFKRNILGLEQKFYHDENVTIFKMQNLFIENNTVFLKMTFSYHFKRIQQNKPKTIYKNTPEVDFWTKSVTGTNEVYSQQTISRLCMIPMKIMKATVSYEQNLSRNSTFLLPFLFFNYLHSIQFDSDQFDDIMKSKQFETSKSKVIQLSSHLASTAVDLSNIFPQALLNNQYLEICLSEFSQQHIFMVQIELLRNQKAVIRVLPIPFTPQMAQKSKQLVNNFTFLLS